MNNQIHWFYYKMPVNIRELYVIINNGFIITVLLFIYSLSYFVYINDLLKWSSFSYVVAWFLFYSVPSYKYMQKIIIVKNNYTPNVYIEDSYNDELLCDHELNNHKLKEYIHN